MAMNGKQILITTESHEIFVIRRARGFGASGYCPHCKTRVEVADPEEFLGRPGEAEGELVHRYIEADIDRDEIDEDKLQVFKDSRPNNDSREA